MVPRKVSYVNGRYLPHDEAYVHIEDRGYQFSDGVYEVMGIINQRLLDEKPHIERLKRSLKSLKIEMPVSENSLRSIINELARRNSVTDGFIYLQVTRGVVSRNHPFPKKNVPPSLSIMFINLKSPPAKDYENGVSVITGEDMRWKRRDIKSISLLANILSKQEAVEKKVKEIWLIDKATGNVTEGSTANAFIINEKGEIVTHPANESILGGVTRDSVLKVAKKAKIKVIEEPFTEKEAKAAKEAFITSTTAGVLPVVKIDDTKISDGKPGKVTKKLIELYNTYVEENTNG